MIEYNKGIFGINLLARVHGSAVYRGMIPGLLSVCFYCAIAFWWRENRGQDEVGEEPDIGHPYAVGVLVGSVSFLIVFRANFGYQRYHEACGAVFHCMSKWLDATTHTASYHMQQKHYKHMRPPSYFDYPEMDEFFLTRDRERGTFASAASTAFPDLVDTNAPPMFNNGQSPGRSRAHKSINYIPDSEVRRSMFHSTGMSDKWEESADEYHEPMPLRGPPRMDGNWSQRFETSSSKVPKRRSGRGGKNNNGPTATFFAMQNNRASRVQASALDEVTRPGSDGSEHKPIIEGFASTAGGRTPPLFLQELAHLSSLLMAVALSTLRNDVEGAESPLEVYIPDSPFPQVDPDKIPKVTASTGSSTDSDTNSSIREEIATEKRLRMSTGYLFRALTGFDPTPKDRTNYNASRPMPVIGGVSDAEIRFLQMAKGPSAKTQLCWQWLSEFIIREHLAGSTGAVGPPIISRIIQFLGDGMIYYNHARKIMFIPFPFPHAQISVFFIFAVIPSVPFLMDQFVGEKWLGALLSFLTVTCLSGLHEVARELENPFRNVPNEIPLVTLQAMFNEGLITMYAGFHPDHYWDPAKYRKQNNWTPPSKDEDGKGGAPKEEDTGRRCGGELDELKQLLREQSKEIARLRTLVEGAPVSPTPASTEAATSVDDHNKELTMNGISKTKVHFA